MAFDLESSSPADTGEGKVLKTGNLKRSYNMAKCPTGQSWNNVKQKCVNVKVTESGFKTAGFDEAKSKVQSNIGMSFEDRMAAHKSKNKSKESSTDRLSRIRKKYGG